MAGALVTVEIAGYQFSVPSEWRIARPVDAGAIGQIHVEPVPDVAVDVQVVKGGAEPPAHDEVLGMYRRSGRSAEPLPPMAGPPGEPCAGVAVQLAATAEKSPVHRELYVCARQDDLLTVALTWSQRAPSLPYLRRVLPLILAGARPAPPPAVTAAAAGPRAKKS